VSTCAIIVADLVNRDRWGHSESVPSFETPLRRLLRMRAGGAASCATLPLPRAGIAQQDEAAVISVLIRRDVGSISSRSAVEHRLVSGWYCAGNEQATIVSSSPK